MAEVRKHHYIPKCYLKAWTGADGLLCEYRRPHERVVVHRRHPSETGWVDRLYHLSGLRQDQVDLIEKQFFQRVDQDASDILSIFRQNRADLSEKQQAGWVRFLMSLMHRHPSQIAILRKMANRTYLDGIDAEASKYDDLKGENDPQTFAEFRAASDDVAIEVLFAKALQAVCESENIGAHILGMKNQVMNFSGRGRGRFITSDRPLLRGMGLGEPQAMLLLPISPHQLFVATNGVEADTALRWVTGGRSVIDTVNQLVARQSLNHVYGVCENHLPFVEEHMGVGLGEPWRLHAGS